MSESRLPPELIENILNRLDLYNVIRFCKQSPEVANICRQNQDKLAIRFASEIGFVQDKEEISNWIKNGLENDKFTSGNVITVVKRLTMLYNYMINQNKTALMYGLYDHIMNAFNKLNEVEIKIYLKILKQYFVYQLDSPRFSKFNVDI